MTSRPILQFLKNRILFPTPLKIIMAIATFLAVVAMIFALFLGSRAGQQQVETQSRQQIGILLQYAEDLRYENRYDEAIVTYERVLLLESNNSDAIKGINELQQLKSGEPIGSQPSVGSTLADEQWEAAQKSFAEGNWDESIVKLDQLLDVNPTYELAQVTDLLARAIIGLAEEKEQDGQFEEALLLLDRAIELKPTAIDARNLRTTIATYQDALTIAGTDWARVVNVLLELERISPDYRDVNERLQNAHMEYGDSFVKAKQWCKAVEQYNLAIAIEVTPGSTSKRNTYRALCEREDPKTASKLTADVTKTTAQVAIPKAKPTLGSAADEEESGSTIKSTPERTSTVTKVGAIALTATVTASARPTIISAPIATSKPVTIAAAQSASTISAAGRIIYSAQDNNDNRSRIFAHQLSSAQPLLLAMDAAQPALRRDGIRLAHRSLRNDAGGITSIDSGTNLTLRYTKFVEDTLPSWSPDGNRIVFSSNREGDRLWRIYTVWAEENSATTFHTFGESPEWHPTLDKIVYRGCDERGNGCGLWTMNGNGGERKQLTDVSADSRPTWSRNGRYVLFMSNVRDGNMELYRVDPNTQAILRLTNTAAIDGSPTVSPDSTSVAFFTNRNGNWEIWAVSINGGTAQKLISITGTLGSNWLNHDLQWVP